MMSDSKNHPVLSRSELVVFHGKKKSMEVLARIDTGATNSSVDSRLVIELGLGPFKTTKVIKSAHGNSIRPLIEAKVTIHGKEFVSLFSVADRKHMRYKVLIGQNILSNAGFLIDPSKHSPHDIRRNGIYDRDE